MGTKLNNAKRIYKWCWARITGKSPSAVAKKMYHWVGDTRPILVGVAGFIRHWEKTIGGIFGNVSHCIHTRGTGQTSAHNPQGFRLMRDTIQPLGRLENGGTIKSGETKDYSWWATPSGGTSDSPNQLGATHTSGRTVAPPRQTHIQRKIPEQKMRVNSQLRERDVRNNSVGRQQTRRKLSSRQQRKNIHLA